MAQPQSTVSSLPVYFNREGYFYVNPALKIHAVQVSTRRKLLQITSSLYQQCQACTTDSCLSEISEKLEKFITTKEKLEKLLNNFDNRLVESYGVCRDLVFDNDIKLCKVEVQQRALQELIRIVNASGVGEL